MSLYYSGERIMVKKIALSSFLLSTLVACGGGGGSSDDGNGGGAQKGNTPPEATGLSITANQGASVEPGTTVTGGYTYTDAEGDTEGATGFRWLIDGTTVGSEQSYTVQASDVGKSIIFEVSPVAITGSLNGQAVLSSAVDINSVNESPIASSVSISDSNEGGVIVGDELVGHYTYSDAEGDAEGVTRFRWLIGGSVVGSEQSYSIQTSDADKFITFEVSPVASTGAITGEAITSTAVSINPLNNSPLASAISITDSNGGSAWAGDELVGHYTYSDAEGDAQGETSLRWLVDGLEVATGNRFLTTKAEAGKSLVFEVTPIASQGTITGLVKSSQPFAMKRDLHYIKANTLERNNNLFVTDGTEAGTLNLELITYGTISQPVKFGEKWFFAVFDTDSSKVRLAETDGSPEGTKIFSQGPNLVAPYTFTEFKGELYFAGHNDEHGTELWVVDDSDAGAHLFKDIDVSFNGGTPARFTVVGEQMFFTAYLSYTGVELWVTNGDSSNAGTYMVKDLTGDYYSANFGDFHGFKNKLYFVQADRLWVSDGTSAGTKELDLSKRSTRATNFITLGDHFFFTDSAVGNNLSLWVSDGLTTKPLEHSQESDSHSINELVSFNDKIYFVNRKNLYEATPLLTKKTDLNNSDLINEHLNPKYLTALNNKLIFSASLTDNNDIELFQYNGSQVSLITDITGDSMSSSPEQLTLLNGEIIFSADDKISGRELWKTDGTESGTKMIKDIKDGSAGSSVSLEF